MCVELTCKTCTARRFIQSTIAPCRFRLIESDEFDRRDVVKLCLRLLHCRLEYILHEHLSTNNAILFGKKHIALPDQIQNLIETTLQRLFLHSSRTENLRFVELQCLFGDVLEQRTHSSAWLNNRDDYY